MKKLDKKNVSSSEKKNSAEKDASKKIWERVKKIMKPYNSMLVTSLACGTLAVLLLLAVLVFAGNAVDAMVGKEQVRYSELWMAMIPFVIASLGTAAFRYLSHSFNDRLAYNMTKDLRDCEFEHIHGLPLRYFDSNPSSKVMKRIVDDVDNLTSGFVKQLTTIFTDAFTILGSLILMIVLDFRVAIIAIILAPLFIWAKKIISDKVSDYFSLQHEVKDEMSVMIHEMVGNQKVVQAFNHQDDVMDQLHLINVRLKKCDQEAIFSASIVKPCIKFLNVLVYAAVAIAGSFAVLNGHLTIGMLGCFLLCTELLTKPLGNIIDLGKQMKKSLLDAEGIFEFLDEKEVDDDSRADILGHEVNGSVEFKNVSFSYIPQLPLIEHLNLHIKPGQKVAIVGENGSGKSTLVNILMRFYELNDGVISIDGTSAEKLRRSSVRKSFGLVLQDTWLKNASIRDNIAYGKPNATIEEIQEAAKAAFADEFIQRLPAGYDTMIGEAGDTLSQGQKQLLCIARMMLRLPPILILDEAASSIDPLTEHRIYERFAEKQKGKTCIIITNRLAAIKDSDLIVVMEDGHIVEQGTHDELLDMDGTYAELFHSQCARA